MGLAFPTAGVRLIRLLDVVAVLWVVLWVALALLVGREVRNLRELSDTVVTAGVAVEETGGLVRNLGSIPFVGGQVSTVADQVEEAGRSAQASGRDSRDSTENLSVLLALSIALIPTLPLLGLYLPLRWAWTNDARAVRRALKRAPTDPLLVEFLARRAVSNFSVRQASRRQSAAVQGPRRGPLRLARARSSSTVSGFATVRPKVRRPQRPILSDVMNAKGAPPEAPVEEGVEEEQQVESTPEVGGLRRTIRGSAPASPRSSPPRRRRASTSSRSPARKRRTSAARRGPRRTPICASRSCRPTRRSSRSSPMPAARPRRSRKTRASPPARSRTTPACARSGSARRRASSKSASGGRRKASPRSQTASSRSSSRTSRSRLSPTPTPSSQVSWTAARTRIWS